MRVFLSGGSSGLGAELVRQLVEEGHEVAFTYRSNGEGARKLAEECGRAGKGHSRAYEMDVGCSASVDGAVDRALDDLEGFDLVINNAGVNDPALLAGQSDDSWNRIIGTNLTGSFHLCRAFLMPFLGQGHGNFIHMGSISATGMAGEAAYSASKAGLEALSASIAREYGPKGIRSNVLRLGLAGAGMGQTIAGDDFAGKWVEACPAGRLMTVPDIMNAIRFLTARDADFINGTVIPVTGGLEQLS